MVKEIALKTTAGLLIAGAIIVSAVLPTSAAGMKPSSSIVDVVTAADGEFDVLQAAVVRAGYVQLLNGGRQFTVFAPTDAAFVSTLGVADEAAAIAAVSAMDVPALQNILSYHVLAGRHSSTSVLARSSYNTLGDRLTKAELATAGIAATDISTRNGIIHVINGVLIP